MTSTKITLPLGWFVVDRLGYVWAVANFTIGFVRVKALLYSGGTECFREE
jgi:hypothetical protein